jgi:hypothetical protein
MAPGIDLSALHTAPTNAPAKQLLTATTSTSTPQILPISLTNPLVLDPSYVTTEFDLLRFHAAAFDQLPKATVIADRDQPSPSSDLLVSSPYNAPQHHLSLSTLPAPSLLFALALTSLAPTTPSYATAPYATALNFPVVIATLRSLVPANYIWPQTDFYVVVFRSELKPHIDMDLLYTLDFESHREACESGGLLKYWFGKADEGRRNLATCKCSV